MNQQLPELVQQASAREGLPYALVFALARVESGLNPCYYSFKPHLGPLWDIRKDALFRPLYEAEVDSLFPPANFHCFPGETRESEWVGQRVRWGLLGVPGCIARQVGYKKTLASLTEVEDNLTVGCRILRKLLNVKEHEQYGWDGLIRMYEFGNPAGSRASDMFVVDVRRSGFPAKHFPSEFTSCGYSAVAT